MIENALSPLHAKDWDAAAARHLLNRAGFGVPEGRVRTLARMSPDEAVRSLVDFERVASAVEEPPFIVGRLELLGHWKAVGKLEGTERQEATRAHNRREREAVQRLKVWWLERMATTPRPLEEKLALFWHGHFATSASKVQSSYMNFALNTTFRENGAGNLKRLTRLVGQSPAMLRYLDNDRNTKFKPNENWARELMELFTLGIGNYSEEDIKNSARAFTGWTNWELRFIYDERRHDYGPKTFLGKRGDFDGWDIVDMIYAQPRAAEFICAKLWSFFAHDNPDQEIVEGLARTLRESNYELKPLLIQLFTARGFYGPKAQGTQIKSPTQFVIQLAHDLGLDPVPYADMAKTSAHLGQDLLMPPNVKGWDGGRAWINANTLLDRYNAPKELIYASAEASQSPDRENNMMVSAGGDGAVMRRTSQARWKKFQVHMRGLPPGDRQALRGRMEEADSARARTGIMLEVVLKETLGRVWDPREAFGGMTRGTPRELADYLATRYLNATLAPEQRRALTLSLTQDQPVNDVLELKEIPTSALNATLQLLFSMAEYQLC
jgi:uncharacterized protein (DUF1800 family)